MKKDSMKRNVKSARDVARIPTNYPGATMTPTKAIKAMTAVHMAVQSGCSPNRKTRRLCLTLSIAARSATPVRVACQALLHEFAGTSDPLAKLSRNDGQQVHPFSWR